MADIDEVLAAEEENKKALEVLGGDDERFFWVETANFVTQKKIRVREIDYKDPEYQSYLAAYLKVTPDAQVTVNEALEKLKKSQEEAKKPGVPVLFGQLEKEQQARDAKTFITVIEYLRIKIKEKGILHHG